jgi:ribulose-phosphate 3-epimerase
LVTIIPAILATTEEEFKEDVLKINSADELVGGLVHIDFADGRYVNNKTIYFEPYESYPPVLEKQAHLMVEDPADFIPRLSTYGFKTVIFHLGVGKENEIIKMVKEHNMEVGLAVNPEVEIEVLEPYLDKVDVVLLMAISPGKQGQEFMPGTLGRIEEVARLRTENGLSFKIGVDGGVSNENIKSLVEAGVDYVVMGSHLTKGDIHANLESIWEALL